ncbi:carboxypeptidase-like regulatory domain-containing protein [Parabacteroides sp. PF5-9]|uniref:carboxypeptidase-like regulatory domain-containing protein n=1 Tax=Parabacteroides sp. PF5-9 TaxID=1742404 RepID=UPI00247589CE|nr:carboxypeptidase-like regulatory domain-containing protein [Parabacteroides sp. PF5-9]MDH6359046.1 hypothetical protein [Parabacteroides sp. PF5-9]
MQRLFLILIFSLFTGMFWGLKAQFSRAAALITVEVDNIPLEELLLIIEKQSNMTFSYESSIVKDFQKISFSASEESLSYCLKRLFSSLPFAYKITGKYIILKKSGFQYTISGFIRDSVSYESLLGASLLDKGSNNGSVSNSYGFFSLTLPAGKVHLRASYVGYEPREINFILQKDTLLEILLPASGRLGEILIEGESIDKDIVTSIPGKTDLSISNITSMPTLLGEPDLVKTLQHLPGVAQGMEGMSALYVRGGNGDENLYLVDGNPVYHVSHLGGFFSAFNADALKNTTFYKGAFPAQYGGRASSVIDVRMKDGDRQQYHGSLSLGLISAKANLEGPIIKGRSSFNFSVRRTWPDLIVASVLSATNRKKTRKLIAGYYFYDINAKLNHSFSDKSQMRLIFYMGDDNFKSGEKYETKDEDLFRWRWGNLVGSMNWNYVFNNNLFANFTIGYSRYRSRVMQTENRFHEKKQIYYNFQDYRSRMEDLSIKADFEIRLHEKHRIRAGTDYLLHFFRPGLNKMESWTKDSISQYSTDTVFNDPFIRGHELSFYAEDELLLNDRIWLRGGFRHTIFHVQGSTYHSFQPRISGRYLIRPEISVKISYSKMNQYVHQLSSTSINLPTDLWVPVTKRIPPIASHHFSAGLYADLAKQYDLSIEGYYKTTDNILEYKDASSIISSFPNWEKRVALGEGRSYGTELMIRKNTGKTRGWLAYTLSWSNRRFNDTGINKGEWFSSKYDNRHKVDLVISHRLSEKVELNANWIFASGNRITLLTDYYLAPSQLPGHIYWGDDYRIILSGSDQRNNYQLPPYHRLDLGINIYRPKKSGNMGIWNFSIYNAYLKDNPIAVEPVVTYSGKEWEVKLYKTTIFNFVPSFSYTYKF